MGTQASEHGTCARVESRASPEAAVALHGEVPREPRYDPQSIVPGLPRPQAVVSPRDGNTGFLVAQDDVDQAVNKAADAQLEAEADLERAAHCE